MPRKTGELTVQERIFAERMAATGDARYAAEKAGYAQPVQRASQNLQKPAVNALITERCTAELHNELRPLANRRLRMILEDDDVAPQHHIAAAKVVFGACQASVGGGAGKDVSDMTPAELTAAIERIELMLAREDAETIEPVEPADADGVFA